MNGSRIWLDLSALFSCTRKQSCIHIDHEKYRTVKDVQDHISRLFDLKRAIHVLNDGWLLPASESSLLFRDNDIVSVVPQDVPKSFPTLEEAKDAPVASNSKEVNGLFKLPATFGVSTISEVPHKPIVTNGNGPVVLIENALTKNSLKNPFADSKLPSLGGDNKPVDEQHPRKNSVSNESLSTPPVLEDEETTSEVGSECKRVRKRIRRRKKKAEKRKASAGETNVDQNPVQTKLNQYRTTKLFQSISYTLNTAMAQNKATVNNAAVDNKKRKHIFFDDPGEEERKKIPTKEEAKQENRLSVTEEPNNVNRFSPTEESTDVDRFSLMEEPKDPKKMTITEEPMNTSHLHDLNQISHTLSSPAREDGALGLAKLMSLGNQKSPAVFERKKPESPQLNEADSNVLIPEQKIKKLKLLPLNELPVKETIIQFKVLKMVNYSPVMSGAITARVISPDFTKKQIFVQIQEGLSELQTEKGKFSLDLDETLNDEVPMGEYLYLDWQDLLEPKAVVYV